MDILTPYTISAMVLNVIASLIGAVLLGPPGPLVGTLMANLLITAWAYPMLLHKHFGIDSSALARAGLGNMIWGLPFVTVVWMVSHSHKIGWFHLILETALFGVVGLALWWTFGLREPERIFWRSRLAGILKTPARVAK